MFSFLSSKSSPNRPDKHHIAEDTLPKNPAPTVEQFARIVSLLAAGKFDQARKASEECGLPVILQDIQQLKDKFQRELSHGVDISIHVNESSNYGAKLNRISKDINHRSQGMAAAVEELSASASSILATSQNASARTDEMISNVAQGVHASRELQHANGEIESVVAQTGVKVEDLVSSTTEINRILKIITEISEKTKLLSLNATIEAARAGEAGKGFAVVANEVKSLAEQTSASADDIKDKVEALTTVTQEISDLMGSVSEAVGTGRQRIEENETAISSIKTNSEEVSSLMSEIMTILRDQEIAVTDISSNTNMIASMTHESVSLIDLTLGAMDKAETELVAMLSNYPDYELTHTTVCLAQSDHVIWKKRLSSMAAGRISLDSSALADHTKCRLGKWYYSDASRDYKNLPVFKDIEASHIAVHKHGIAAVEKYNRHDLDGALTEIDQVEIASVEVLDKLAKLAQS